MTINKSEITIGDLQDLAEQLRRASGLPYYVKRDGAYMTLFATLDGEGKPTFGGKVKNTVAAMSARSLADFIETRIEGIQSGFEVVKRVQAHYVKDGSPRNPALQEPFPTFDRAEFCSNCGALVFGHGESIHFDVRERHDDHDLCPRPNGKPR